MANGVCFLIDKNTYNRYLERVQWIVAEQASPTQDSNTWQAFCTRFRGGPIGKTILENETDSPDPSQRIPESPPARYRILRLSRPYPTPQLHISLSYGEKHEYIPREDNEDLNQEEWEKHPQRPRHYQLNEMLRDRLRWLEDDNQWLIWIMEFLDLYSYSK